MFNDFDKKPRKRSYYPFSKDFPGSRTGMSYDIGESRERRKRERRSRLAFAAGLLLLFVFAFTGLSVGISLSNRPVSEGGGPASEEGIHALYMPSQVLDGGTSLDLFRNELKEQEANAVLVDLKSAEGYLNYPSALERAEDITANSRAYSKAGETVRGLQNDGYKIIVRIYCFRDMLAASRISGAAVYEAGGASIWLDDSAENDGMPWLNPYAEDARNYLLDIIGEAAKMQVDMIVLSDVSFPEGDTQNAVFPGEAESLLSRNAVLQFFMEQAAERAGEVPVAAEMTAQSALEGDAALYGGSLFDSAAQWCAPDLRTKSIQGEWELNGKGFKPDGDEAAFGAAAATALRGGLSENYTTAFMLPIVSTKAAADALTAAGQSDWILVLP